MKPANSISVTAEQELYGLCCGLFVDGIPIQEKLQSGDGAIPFWLAHEGLPCYVSDSGLQESALRLVAVCSCGEPGCGHTRCRVRRSADTVIFEDFIGERDHSRQNARYVFRSEEFDAVESFMVETTRRERGLK